MDRLAIYVRGLAEQDPCEIGSIYHASALPLPSSIFRPEDLHLFSRRRCVFYKKINIDSSRLRRIVLCETSSKGWLPHAFRKFSRLEEVTFVEVRAPFDFGDADHWDKGNPEDLGEWVGRYLTEGRAAIAFKIVVEVVEGHERRVRDAMAEVAGSEDIDKLVWRGPERRDYLELDESS